MAEEYWRIAFRRCVGLTLEAAQAEFPTVIFQPTLVDGQAVSLCTDQMGLKIQVVLEQDKIVAIGNVVT